MVIAENGGNEINSSAWEHASLPLTQKLQFEAFGMHIPEYKKIHSWTTRKEGKWQEFIPCSRKLTYVWVRSPSHRKLNMWDQVAGRRYSWWVVIGRSSILHPRNAIGEWSRSSTRLGNQNTSPDLKMYEKPQWRAKTPERRKYFYIKDVPFKSFTWRFWLPIKLQLKLALSQV